MNLENIQAGLRIPNYRKLCALLGEAVEAGNSKKAQILRWEQYFAYRREKNAYIITEVYQIPRQIQDQRMKYTQYLTPILLRHLALMGASEHTMDRWFVLLGMVSEALYDEEKRDDLCAYMRLDSADMQKLLLMLNSLCRSSLMNTLRRLEKEGTISIAENEYIITGNTRRLASEEERQQIATCKNQAMQQLDVKDMFSVHINPNRRKRFYETLHKIFVEKHGWDRTYMLLSVTPLEMDEIQRYADTDITQTVEALRNELQTQITTQLRIECDKADKKHLDEWEDNDVTTSFKLNRMTAESLIHLLWNEV